MTDRDRIRILFVDDSDDDVREIVDAINAADLELVSRRVGDAAALREVLPAEDWDVIISDHILAKLTAAEALSIAREADAGRPFIVVSASARAESVVELMRAGAHDYIPRADLARLVPALRREVGGSAERRRRREAEAATRALTQRYLTTVDRAPVGIVNVSPDGHVVDANPRFCELLGYTLEELRARRLSDLMHPADAARESSRFDALIAGSLREYRSEPRYIRSDGAEVSLALSSAAVHDESGAVTHVASFMLDMTETRNLEAVLRQQEARYRQIVDTTHEGIWTIDPEGRTSFVNARMADMLGWSVVEMAGRSFADFIDDRGVTLAPEMWSRRSSWQADLALRRRDDSRLWVHIASTILEASDGGQSGTLMMVTDVTSRREAESLLQRQKGELEEAQKIAQIGSWRRRGAHDAAEWSSELYRIFGIEPYSVQSSNQFFLEAVVPEDRERVSAAMTRATAENAPIDVEYQIKRPDGSRRYLHTRGAVTVAADGSRSEYTGITQDLTERVQAEAEQRQLSRHVQLLLQSTTQGIFGIDRRGRCTFVNRAASDALGYRPESLVGRPIHEIVHPEHPAGTAYAYEDCPIVAAARSGEISEIQDDLLWTSSGSSIPVEYSAAPIIDRGEVLGAVVVFTDVSERKLLQAQLAQVDRLSSLGRLAATVAHEFNNVLMGIQPFAEVLSRKYTDEGIRRSTHHILQAVQRGRRVTQEILNFTRPVEPVKETVEVSGWLRQLEGSICAVLGPGIRYTVRAEGAALFIRGDRQQLEQVLTNLAVNARDAMTEKGEFAIVVERCMSGQTFPFGAMRTADLYLHLRVSDSGVGMDEETLRHVFDPFFTTKRSGTGLGLAIVHQIVRLHGGSIVAESSVGAGTSFHLFLPLAEEAFSTEEPVRDVVSLASSTSVLMVEDDEAIAAGIAALLEEEGIRVEVASTGREALAMLALARPDVVLLDLGLPDMDGVAVYERIAASHPDLAVIFATGNHDVGILDPYLKAGHVATLSKPYEFRELLDLLGSVLSASRGD